MRSRRLLPLSSVTISLFFALRRHCLQTIKKLHLSLLSAFHGLTNWIRHVGATAVQRERERQGETRREEERKRDYGDYGDVGDVRLLMSG